MIPLAVALFFGAVVALTGPAFDGVREREARRRRERRDFPAARVLYLPPASCRPGPLSGRCLEPGCAICCMQGACLV